MTLSELIGEYLLANGLSEAYRMRLTQIGIDGLREFNIDVTGIPKIATLPVTSVDTVDLPNDFVNYIRIGVSGNDGQIHSLGVNNNLDISKHVDKCGNDLRPRHKHNDTFEGMPFSDVLLPFFSVDFIPTHFRNGETLGAFFSQGGGNNQFGYYRVDLRNWVIHVQGLSHRPHNHPLVPHRDADNDFDNDNVKEHHHKHHHHIVLEYLSDLEKITVEGRKQLRIHPFIIEALKQWIYWKFIEKNRTYNASQQSEAERRFWNAFTLSVARVNSPNIEELLQAYRKENTLTTKL